MKTFLLIGGIICLGLSFFVKAYFLQFLVVGGLFLGFYLAWKRTSELDELKKIIKEHNELMKEDIELLRKDQD